MIIPVWIPKPGDFVRCVKGGDYFSFGNVYKVAKSPKKGYSGVFIYETLGYAVLTRIANFEPWEER